MRSLGLIVVTFAVVGCQLVAGLEERGVAQVGGAGGVGGVGGTGGAQNGGGGAVPAVARWPDSPSSDAYCTDGTMEVSGCPMQGMPGHGQDCCYSYAIPTYEPTGNGTVIDSVTELEWDEGSTIASVGWEDAKSHCADRQNGWRLPSRLELASLVNYGGTPPVVGWTDDRHWTSTPTGDNADVWTVDFSTMHQLQWDKTDVAFVICVRGEELANDFDATDEDVLYDRMSGLSWQRVPTGDEITWLDALNHCAAYEGGGWRMPSAKELLTVVADDEQWVPQLEDQAGRYWTSSPDADDKANDVRFPDGTMSHEATEFMHYVRCVRGPETMP